MDDPDMHGNQVGTGPCVLDSRARGEQLKLVRNDDYWREPATLDSVTFIPIAEGTTRISMVESGAANVAINVPPQDVERINALAGVQDHQVERMRYIYIFINNSLE